MRAIRAVPVCLSLIVLLATATPSRAAATAWVARYDGPQHNTDAALGVAAAPDGGRVFVTGKVSSGGGRYIYTTLGYDAATGDQLWATPYDNGYDIPYGISVSPDSSKVFVTGGNATVAYDAATGAQLWVDVEGSFTGRSIAMSPDGTRTYVTGSFGTTYGIVTFAFDSATGAQVWHANHQGPYAQGRLVGTSPDGTRIFSVGLSYGPNNYDEVVIGYDAASGSHLWTSIYDGPEHSEDIPAALGVSPNGGWIYVTGSTENPSYGSFDYATVAIDAATGAQLWSATFDDPGHASDDPSALGMSPDGSRVYVTGTTHDGFPPVDRADFATLAYDASTGALVWKARYDGPAGRADKAFALGVDPGGLAVYVTGSSKGVTTNEDYATLAYDASTGAQLWENRYDGPADNNDVPTSLAVSPSGDAVYVTGTSVGIDTLHDFATMRINV